MGEVVEFSEALSAKQRECALLMAQGCSCRQTAELTGLAVQTLYNWRSGHADFRQELRRLQNRVYAEGVEQIRSLVGQATETLRVIMADPDAAHRDKLAAARAVLDYAGVSPEVATEFPDEPVDEEFEALFAKVQAVIGEADAG